jgi:FSR family fosmidomycin resistance protein-like MFS transporter
MNSAPAEGHVSQQPSEPLRKLHPGVWTLVLLSLGHFFIDLYSGAIGIFQPMLIRQLGLSLTQAGIIGGLLAFSGSVTQPLYGYLSDRVRSRLFSGLAPAVAGLFVCGLSVAPSFGWALLFAALGGAGIASFHPQGSAWAAAGMRANRAQWMAIFISCGTLGIALAPAFFSAWMTTFGFPNVIWAAIPGVALSLLLLIWMPVPREVTDGPRTRFEWKALQVIWRPLSLLYLAVFARSVVQVTYAQFLALYLHRERGYPLQQAAWILTAYLTAGALGGVAGGPLSDRFGARRVIMWSFLFSFPLMAVFFLHHGWLGMVCLAAGGFVLLFTIPVNVVVAQRLAPAQAGTVSALMMGFAWGSAGMIFVPLTGWLSDRTSLHAALFTLLVFPLLGFLVTRLLPEEIGQ